MRGSSEELGLGEMANANGGSRGGKRAFEGYDDQQQNDPKRPALASVIVEALKLDSLQKLCSSLEPILRRVVSEEVERALAKLGPARLPGRKKAAEKRARAKLVELDDDDENEISP